MSSLRSSWGGWEHPHAASQDEQKGARDASEIHEAIALLACCSCSRDASKKERGAIFVLASSTRRVGSRQSVQWGSDTSRLPAQCRTEGLPALMIGEGSKANLMAAARTFSVPECKTFGLYNSWLGLVEKGGNTNTSGERPTQDLCLEGSMQIIM